MLHQMAAKELLPRLAKFLTSSGGAASSVQAAAQAALKASPSRFYRPSCLYEILTQKHALSFSQAHSCEALLHSIGQGVKQSTVVDRHVSASLARNSLVWAVQSKSISTPSSSFQHRFVSGSEAATSASVRRQHTSAGPERPVASASNDAARKAQEGSSGSGSKGGGAGTGTGTGTGTGRGFFSGLQNVPLLPLLLGFGGAIPFVALAPPVAPLLPLPEDMKRRRAEWHAAYGAVIASFLGAVHWGLAMADHAQRGAITSASVSTLRYTWGVTPALLAWYALLLPPAEKFAALAGVIGVAFLVDAGFTQLQLLPRWYLPLRASLTLFAVGSLVSSWSVAVVKSTYDRSRNHSITSKEGQLPASVTKPETKVL